MSVLFGKAKAGTARTELVEFLKYVAAGTASSVGFALGLQSMVDKSEKYEPGLIEVNKAIPVDPAGNLQMRLTEKGKLAMTTLSAPVAAEPAVAKRTFEIVQGVAIPESKRGGIREATYPFELLEIGASFFIPATADNPTPAKTMGSTVSSANKRYASVYPAFKGKDANGNKIPHPKAGQATGKDGRKFTVRPRITGDGEMSNGARVWRIA